MNQFGPLQCSEFGKYPSMQTQQLIQLLTILILKSSCACTASLANILRCRHNNRFSSFASEDLKYNPQMAYTTRASVAATIELRPPELPNISRCPKSKRWRRHCSRDLLHPELTNGLHHQVQDSSTGTSRLCTLPKSFLHSAPAVSSQSQTFFCSIFCVKVINSTGEGEEEKRRKNCECCLVELGHINRPPDPKLESIR